MICWLKPRDENMKKLIVGNWKMNGSAALLHDMIMGLVDFNVKNVDVVICPPYPYITMAAAMMCADKISVGAQDCSIHESGAYTGEVSVEMLRDCGAKYVIVGHSERRQYHNETNEMVKQKAMLVFASGMTPIICVGETQSEKESGQTLSVIEKQVRESVFVAPGVVVAYEPIWAIGTGLVATVDDVKTVHAHIATVLGSMGLSDTKILYGGSVKGSNASEILETENVQGVLVGGASLRIDDFVPIIDAVK